MPCASRSSVAPERRAAAQACVRRLGLDRRILPGGADRDVRDVRRAAAAAQNRHRQRQPERGVLPLCPAIR